VYILSSAETSGSSMACSHWKYERGKESEREGREKRREKVNRDL
jgi:hypothetical protein